MTDLNLQHFIWAHAQVICRISDMHIVTQKVRRQLPPLLQCLVAPMLAFHIVYLKKALIS